MLNDGSELVVRRNYKIKGWDYGTYEIIFLKRVRLNLYFTLWMNDFTAASQTIQTTTPVESF